jgi:photosystem II stability/assembly factor-like uncharacterized protein
MNQKNWQRLMGLLCICFALAAVARANDSAGRFEGWQTVGPSGGDVREVVIDPKNTNHLIISTLDGQIYTSNDAGKSWQLAVNFNRPQMVLDQLIIDSRDSNVIYTSGHRGSDPGGFFKSKDGGVTWKEAKELKNEAIHAMIQSSKNPDLLLVGTVGGVWISTDSGEDWKKIESSTAPLKVNSLAIDPIDTNIIYAGTWWRAYKTTDGGKNWRLIKDGMIDDSDVFAIDIDPRNPDHIIASACSGIYNSINKGEKWTKVNGIPSQSRRTRDILQHVGIPGTVYAATTEGFWMSSDSGKSWVLTTTRQLEINSIAVHPENPNRVYIGTNNYGVMVSNDGGKTFAQTNGNFSSRLTYSITADSEQSNRLYATTINTATGGGFVFVSNDRGRTWSPAMKNITGNILIPYSLLQDKKNPNTIYLATNIGTYRSIDRGNSWAQLAAPPAKRPAPKRRAVAARSKGKAPAKKTTAAQAATIKAATTADTAKPETHVPALITKVNVLAHTEDGKYGIFAGTAKGLYRSYDPVKGWEKLSFGAGIDEQVFAIAVSPQNPSVIWAGTATNGVIVSKDGGATWAKVPGVPEIIPVSTIAIDPKRAENIYVGTIQTLYLSRDGGKSWTRRGGNLPLGNYSSILINPRNSNEIFVGSSLITNGGIYQSVDAGSSWKRIDGKDERVASRRVWSMAFDPNDSNRIFAGTHSAGVYRIERPAMTADANETITRPRVTVSGN